MDKATIGIINNILADGDRIELIPCRDEVKVIRVKREKVTTCPRKSVENKSEI